MENKAFNIVGIIPARYQSTRFQGKPLADICGHPMIWWVHKQFKLAKGISEVYVATDDERISSVCEQFGMKFIMTSNQHSTHLDRLAEVAQKIKADFYININGDEPLMMPEYIEDLLPSEDIDPKGFYFANAMTRIKKPVEVNDVSRIKIVTDYQSNALYLSRTPIPYPKASSDFDYMKFVGIQCFSREALLFCGTTPRGHLEGIEDIDEYRFIENDKKMRMVEIPAETLSVDTQADLTVVKRVISRRIQNGEIIL